MKIPIHHRSTNDRYLCLRPAAGRLLWVGLLLGFSLVATTLAGHITLQISTTPSVADKQILCAVSIVNQGDEAAANVQAHVEFMGRRYSAQVMPLLAVGQNYTGSYQIPAENLAPGRYTLVVMADYTDTNGYPFTALSNAGFTFREDFPPQIHGMSEPVDLGGTADLTVRLKNQGKKKQQIQITLVLPKEISADQTEVSLSLEAAQEKNVELGLRNFSALEGSTYQVFVLAEYTEEGKHTSMPIPCTIKITAARSFYQKYRLFIITAAAALAVLFAGIQVYTFFRRKHHPHRQP